MSTAARPTYCVLRCSISYLLSTALVKITSPADAASFTATYPTLASNNYLSFLNYNGKDLYMGTGSVAINMATTGSFTAFAKFRFNSQSSWSRVFDCGDSTHAVSRAVARSSPCFLPLDHWVPTYCREISSWPNMARVRRRWPS